MTAPQPVPTFVTGHLNQPLGHPSWCDPALCTADPAATTIDGYRAGSGGEHRSAPVPLDLRTAMWFPARTGTAYLRESVAPWRCSAYLRVQVGDTEVSVTVDHAGPILDALSALVATARAVEGTA
jgi:hypothetical protein